MEIIETKIKGCFLIKNEVFSDDRGRFFSPYVQKILEEIVGEPINWVQDNQSYSKKNVVRGIHFQKEPHAQAKFVRCSYGLVKDVVVDLRKESATYGQFESFYLSGENGLCVYIPKGCGHGFSTLSKEAVFDYKVDQYWNRLSESGIIYNDKNLNIDWEVDNPIISKKDLELPNL